MKIYLFKNENTEPKLRKAHVASLHVALQFAKQTVSVTSDYELPALEIEGVAFSVKQKDEMIEELASEPSALVAHDQTIFVAESLADITGAHQHFSQNHDTIIQLPIHNNFFERPAPTIIMYGGRRMWTTGTRLWVSEEQPIPVAFGTGKILAETITRQFQQKPYFTDLIFHGGKQTILTPLPPLAFDLRFPLPAQVSSAAFDAEQYIANLPVDLSDSGDK